VIFGVTSGASAESQVPPAMPPDGWPKWVPRGLVVRPNSSAFRELHSQWGSHPIYSGSLAASLGGAFRYPDNASSLNVQLQSDGAACEWRNLTDGTNRFPQDVLVVSLTRTGPGKWTVTASGSTSDGDIAGIIVPLVTEEPAWSIVVPSFGGVAYQPEDFAQPSLKSLGGAPFLEAPFLSLDSPSGSTALWQEERRFPTRYAFLGAEGGMVALGIESVSLMPFEGKRRIGPITWKLGRFQGDWRDAAVPYRTWYESAFSSEILRRTENGWADSIQVIVDSLPTSESTLEWLARELNPRSVLLHDWNMRRAPFDTELPDWSLREQFMVWSQRARELAFRVMGYVNSYCVNIGSAAYKADRIGEFALPRAIPSLPAYGNTPVRLGDLPTGAIAYLDPLSSRWRSYHVGQMANLVQSRLVDALYEDTAGTAGDFGNGVVGGLSGAEGGAQQMREMQQSVGVPMATEFCPDSIAFSSNWSLRYSQAWGDMAIRRWWSTRHRPVTPHLFAGAGRAWVPTVAASSCESKAIVVGCSDALGGVAQVPGNEALLRATSGLAGHMVRRARWFSSLGLRPHLGPLDGGGGDPRLACRYRTSDGAFFDYLVEGTHQSMIGPSGVPLYERVSGMAEIVSPLRIAGWPAANGDRTLALQTTCDYALDVSPSELLGCAGWLSVDSVTSGTCISRACGGDEGFAIRFRALQGDDMSGKTASVLLRRPVATLVEVSSSGRAIRVIRNAAAGARLELDLGDVAAIVGIASATSSLTQMGDYLPMSRAYFVEQQTGIERGSTYQAANRRLMELEGASLPIPMQNVSGGDDAEICLDYIVNPMGRPTSAEFFFQNASDTHGNGSEIGVAVNGIEVLRRDLAPEAGTTVKSQRKWDLGGYRCTVNLDEFGEGPWVLTIIGWGKSDDNADRLWVSPIRLIPARGGPGVTLEVLRANPRP